MTLADAPRLLRRRTSAELAVTPRSIALFRLGEQCNHRCPMCSNSGRPEAFFQPLETLLGRADFLHARGLRRVVLTGGEPTIHPGFWDVVARLGTHGMAWDINTNGRNFAKVGFADRAADEGLLRAIVSLHAHEAADSLVISGMAERGHDEILAGIDQLLGAGVEVTVNCVLTTLTRGKLLAYLDFCHERWGTAAALKLCFPTTLGKGGDWEGIQLRYADVQDELRAVVQRGDELGLDVQTESLPPCVLGDPGRRDVSRSGFGETHYLDDVTGDRLYPIGHIEAELAVYPESCRGCQALARCPGVSEAYVRRHGAGELVAFR